MHPKLLAYQRLPHTRAFLARASLLFGRPIVFCALVIALGWTLPGCTGDPGGALFDAGWADGQVRRDATFGGDGGEATDGSVGGGDAGDEIPASRWLDLEGVVNARDLGGHEAAGGGAVRWRSILRGGTLSGLTQVGCGAFEELGVTTVIDLREPAEQAAAPLPSCVSQVSTAVSVPMPKILPPTEASYLALMEQSEASVALLFQTLGQAGAGPAYIQCVIGRDRASFASALVLLALGASRSVVLAEFMLSNDVGITVEAAHLEAVLDAIDAEGGIGPYLARLGVTQGQIDSLRAWALE